MINLAKMLIQSPIEGKIRNNFIQIEDPKKLPMYCVDGRKGNKSGQYLQALGGSYHLVTLNWLLNSGKASEYNNIRQETFSKLKECGYKISVHKGGHAHNDKSDCGFADNNGLIIKTLGEKADEIWQLIIQAKPALKEELQTWKEITELINRAEVDELPSGNYLINQALNNFQADEQMLEGDHGEIAAVVNLKKNTTLDVDENQETPAFNLDLWFVMDQAKKLELNEKKSLLLSLGLYVATEMVLVEDKGKERLPIFVRE